MSRSVRFSIVPLSCVTLASLAVAVLMYGSDARYPDVTTVVSSIRADWSLEKAVDAADTIVIGCVEGVGTPSLSDEAPGALGEPSLGRAVRVPVTLAVTEVLKGTARAGDAVTLAQLGGTVGELSYKFEDETEFQPGERVLVCLYRPTGAYSVWTGGAFHASQGKYLLDAAGQAHNAYRHETMSVQNLKDRIQEVLDRR